MKCPNCGFENEEQANFCKKCGKELKIISKENNSNNVERTNGNFMIILAFLIGLIIIVGAIALTNSSNNNSSVNANVPNEVLDTYLTIEPNEPLDGSDAMIKGSKLKVKLTDSNANGVARETVYIMVEDIHSWDNYTYECTLDNDGLGFINLDVPVSEYEITADFVGDSHYHASAQTIQMIVLEGYQEITQSSEPLVEGVDYDYSKLTPEQWEKVKNNPGGHYSGGNYYGPGEGQ